MSGILNGHTSIAVAAHVAEAICFTLRRHILLCCYLHAHAPWSRATDAKLALTISDHSGRLYMAILEARKDCLLLLSTSTLCHF